MKRYVHRIVVAALAAGIAALTVACQTVPEEIPEGLSRMEMFQRAQEAVEVERWEIALRYYEEFIRRFPDEPGAIVEAEYEIAFIAYKQEQYRESIELFEAILQKYQEDETGLLPEWPRVLSLRLLEIIDERMFEEGLLDGDVPSA